MSQLQDRAFKRLATFIQSMPLRLRSGIQIARPDKRTNRGDKNRALTNEQVTYTKTRQYIHFEAFNRLNSWQTGEISLATPHSLLAPYSKPTSPHVNESSPVTNKPPTFRNTQPLSPESYGRRKSPQTHPLSPSSLPTSAQEHLHFKGNKVPQPSRNLNLALQFMELMGFSRAHRRLFLLIDGNRSINDLARLIGRTPDEVSELLRNLEDANLF